MFPRRVLAESSSNNGLSARTSRTIERQGVYGTAPGGRRPGFGTRESPPGWRRYLQSNRPELQIDGGQRVGTPSTTQATSFEPWELQGAVSFTM